MGEFQIVLPEGRLRKVSLEKKLEEYRERIQSGPFIHPTLSRTVSNKTNIGYRIDLLEKLFEEGELNTYEFSLELKKRDGSFSPEEYNEAVAIIRDYCNTGGRHLVGGTGLKAS